MDTKRLIDLIEVKDRYACAMLDYYISKNITITNALQQYVDGVCDNMAINFIESHIDMFNDKQVQTEVFRYLNSLGVKQGHTGKRFSEALYRQLRKYHTYLNSQEKNQLSK